MGLVALFCMSSLPPPGSSIGKYKQKLAILHGLFCKKIHLYLDTCLCFIKLHTLGQGVYYKCVGRDFNNTPDKHIRQHIFVFIFT